ncbi:MAG: PQQ-dependent sugar dehydrogenase [Nitrososphaeraceae archaeon]
MLGRKKKKEPSILLGKVLRIDRDGKIPEDNPFPDSPVYTLGHISMELHLTLNRD